MKHKTTTPARAFIDLLTPLSVVSSVERIHCVDSVISPNLHAYASTSLISCKDNSPGKELSWLVDSFTTNVQSAYLNSPPQFAPPSVNQRSHGQILFLQVNPDRAQTAFMSRSNGDLGNPGLSDCRVAGWQ